MLGKHLWRAQARASRTSARLLTLPVDPPFPAPRAEALALVAVIVTEVVCIFYLRADAIVAPCVGEPGAFVPPGQANTCAQLLAFKQTSDVGVTFLLCFISFGVIAVLVASIVYLRIREAALANPNSRAAAWMRTTCGRRLERYAAKLEVSKVRESEAVARVEARKAAKAAAKAKTKAGSDSAGVGALGDLSRDGSGPGGRGSAGGRGGAGGRSIESGGAGSHQPVNRAAFDPTRADDNAAVAAATFGSAPGVGNRADALTTNPMHAAMVAQKARPAAQAGAVQAPSKAAEAAPLPATPPAPPQASPPVPPSAPPPAPPASAEAKKATAESAAAAVKALAGSAVIVEATESAKAATPAFAAVAAAPAVSPKVAPAALLKDTPAAASSASLARTLAALQVAPGAASIVQQSSNVASIREKLERPDAVAVAVAVAKAAAPKAAAAASASAPKAAAATPPPQRK